jgi:geranylgeranyl reductase family protein
MITASNETCCDVLIVGGGPAGSTCAERLRQQGFSVIILDKATFPRHKTCGGWITPPILRLLKLSLDDYRREHVAQPITGFRTGVIGWSSLVETSYGEEVSYGIRRCEFDNYLLNRSGATLRLGEKLDSLEPGQDGWIVNRKIQARVIVGAAGHFCPIAKRLNPENESRDEVVQAQEIEFLMDPEQQNQCAVSRTIPELYFCRDLKGYGWCFRKGDYLNVGLGREGEQHLHQHVADFVESLRATGRIRFEIPGAFKGHAYRLYGRTMRRLVSDRMLLIGDALGLASPRSGEGIRQAIESGLLAAEAIVRSDGNYRQSKLQAYADAIQERFGIAGRRSILDRLPKSPLNAIARGLLRSRYFTRHMLLDRWFLHANQPDLKTDLNRSGLVIQT